LETQLQEHPPTSNHEHPKVRAIYVVGVTSMVKDNELGSFVCFNLFEMNVNFGT
jgi:hypothetical protein